MIKLNNLLNISDKTLYHKQAKERKNKFKILWKNNKKEKKLCKKNCRKLLN